MNFQPIFPKKPLAAAVSLTAQTACTTRAPTATAGLAGANIKQFIGAKTDGFRVDNISVQGSSTSITANTTALVVQIWWYDVTAGIAYLKDEIPVVALGTAPSTTLVAFQASRDYSNWVLPAAWEVWISVTVATTASTNALTATATGGEF